MSEVCRSFGISRKTDDKIFNLYKEDGLEALCGRTDLRMAGAMPQAGKGLREPVAQCARLPQTGVDTTHAAKALFKPNDFADLLLSKYHGLQDTAG